MNVCSERMLDEYTKKHYDEHLCSMIFDVLMEVLQKTI